MRQTTKEQIEEQLEAGVIEPSSSEWSSPVVFAPNKDGRLRFCVEYRRVNAAKIADSYPSPRMEDFLGILGDASDFSTLDAMAGYWQIPVREEYRDKTTFTSHVGTFRYLRMPFGLRNSPATF